MYMTFLHISDVPSSFFFFLFFDFLRAENPTEAVEEAVLGNYAANNADSAMLLRVWNVKKSDPTIPVYVKSANRKLAAIKPRYVFDCDCI